MKLPANQPDPHRPLAAHVDWHILNAGNRTLTQAEITALDEFGARVRQADDIQFEAWGINTPSLRTDIRNPFNTPWPVAQ